MNEHQHQAAVIKWSILQRAKYPQLDLLHAIPNGGHRHKVVGGKLKAEGVKKGVPDLCLPVARDGFHGLYIEMKTEKGSARPDQVDWHDRLRVEGYRVEVCKGWQPAVDCLREYLKCAG